MTKFILNADDYALTRGISDGIVALAEAGRLSATSAMVTTPHWPRVAATAAALRDRIAVGLHLNLTDGPPISLMPHLAADGILPTPGQMSSRAYGRLLDRNEIATEIAAQLDRFQEATGFPPDFVDGHHHVHVLPGIREALIDELKRRFPSGGPLLRDPSDRFASIVRRRHAGKALKVASMALGFAARAHAAGFIVNDGFSGVSSFGEVPFADEFESFLIMPGARPMIMCHPGLADDELGAADQIAARRPEEYALIAARPDIPDLIWRPDRAASDARFPW